VEVDPKEVVLLFSSTDEVDILLDPDGIEVELDGMVVERDAEVEELEGTDDDDTGDVRLPVRGAVEVDPKEVVLLLSSEDEVNEVDEEMVEFSYPPPPLFPPPAPPLLPPDEPPDEPDELEDSEEFVTIIVNVDPDDVKVLVLVDQAMDQLFPGKLVYHEVENAEDVAKTSGGGV
jgi:hypothetical protein